MDEVVTPIIQSLAEKSGYVALLLGAVWWLLKRDDKSDKKNEELIKASQDKCATENAELKKKVDAASGEHKALLGGLLMENHKTNAASNQLGNRMMDFMEESKDELKQHREELAKHREVTAETLSVLRKLK